MEITPAIVNLHWLFASFVLFTEINQEICIISVIWTFVPFEV